MWRMEFTKLSFAPNIQFTISCQCSWKWPSANFRYFSVRKVFYESRQWTTFL